MMYTDLNQGEAAELKDRELTAILPIGVMEVHGNHLSLGTDTFLVDALAKKAEERLGEEHCVILPTVPYGQVWSLGKAPGSIHIPDELFVRFLVQIGFGVWQVGIKRIVILNTHVGNAGTMKAAARILYDECLLKMCLFMYPGADETIERMYAVPLPHKGYSHACEIETSYMLYLYPDKVWTEEAVCQYPGFPEEFDYTPASQTDLMDVVVLGDTTQATEEKGQGIIDGVVETICGILKGEGNKSCETCR